MKADKALLEMEDYVDRLRKISVRSSIPASTQLRRLFEATKALEDKIDNPTVPKSILDAEEVWAKWVSLNYDFSLLDNREQLALCVDPRTAFRPELITSLIAYPEALRRVSTFNGMVMTYFSMWRNFGEPDKLEQFLITKIRCDNIKRGKKYLATWVEYAGLFSIGADKVIAGRMISKKISVTDACKEFYVSPSSDLAHSAEEQALKLAVKLLVNQETTSIGSGSLLQLNWILDTLIPDSISKACFGQAMEKLILSTLGDRLEEAKKKLLHTTTNDARLGDPRLSGTEANWRSISTVVREKILSWLAGETIDFFFNAVSGDRRRADFWLAYAAKPGNIKDFQVALCDDDEYRIKTKSLEKITYSKLLREKTSAFMMLFTGYDGIHYVIIEFSKTGNAAYIYKKTSFDANKMTFRSPSFKMDELKQRDVAIRRISHINDWETEAKRFLYERGIKP